MAVIVRPAHAADAGFLVEMLAEAAAWRPDSPRLSARQVLDDPSLAKYIAGWPRVGDHGVVAEKVPTGRSGDDRTPRRLGAAWWRFFDPAAAGYGFVDATIPEVSIAVHPTERGRGVGGRLLAALLADATARAVRVSLSVEIENPAVRLYRRHGFEVVGEADRAFTMLREP